MKFIIFFIALFAIGIPVVMVVQSFGNNANSFDTENNPGGGYGCLGNMLGLFLVLVLFALAAAVSKFF